MINCCGIDYKITKEKATNVYDHVTFPGELENMDQDEEENVLNNHVDIRGFIRKLFNAAKYNHMLGKDWFIDAHNFLRLVLECPTIPDESILKAACLYMSKSRKVRLCTKITTFL